MNLYLIGYRCTGKTTLGQALAVKMGWSFVDMDDAIVAAEGRSIAHIVAQFGWDCFRRREKAMLKEISLKKQVVVGTGGGVVLDAENVQQMRASGKVVWLRAAAKTIRCLIEEDARTADLRPSLTGAALADEIEETLTQREPLYRAAMDFAVDTDRFDVEKLCNEIIGQLKAKGVAL